MGYVLIFWLNQLSYNLNSSFNHGFISSMMLSNVAAYTFLKNDIYHTI